jgi:hypothetical protein
MADTVSITPSIVPTAAWITNNIILCLMF